MSRESLEHRRVRSHNDLEQGEIETTDAALSHPDALAVVVAGYLPSERAIRPA